MYACNGNVFYVQWHTDVITVFTRAADFAEHSSSFQDSCDFATSSPCGLRQQLSLYLLLLSK